MSISANNQLLNMICTVKELNDKHQLNPRNNGVCEVDRCLCYMHSNIGIGSIMRINILGQYSLCRITLKDCILYTNSTTRFLSTSGNYVCAADGTLSKATDLVKVNSDGTTSVVSVIDVESTSQEALCYQIRTNRGNYITSQGLVVESD